MVYRETEHTRAKKSQTRERLLKAARDLVAESGFAAATAVAVASRSGVAAGSIYRHFPNKSELVAEVFRYATEHEVANVLTASAPLSDDEACAKRLSRAVTVFARRALQGPKLAYALIAEPVDPRVEQERLKYRLAYAEIFEDLIDEGMQRGEFALQDASISAAALVGLLSEALVGPLSTQRGACIAEYGDDAQSDSDICDGKKTDEQQAQLVRQLTALCMRALGTAVTV
ncbi:MAG: TetR family transcriptional regulator [Oleibacter sp.]|nr:TetR family transcriptional regulator [Thalassolituus sp.]|tara:strand:+ start:794 stop:1483 length:690 start_codon:yes stop_codon:yes gene_type:complete